MEDKKSYCTWRWDARYKRWQTDCGWHPTVKDLGLMHCPACSRRIYMEPKGGREMSELLPCPFCGGEAVLNHDYKPIPERWHWGECTVCGIQGKPEYEECDAVLNWNTRPEKVCRWRKDRDEWAGEIVFCSECDDEWWLDCDSPEDAGYHYCPNCGGKIEVKEA